MAYWRKTVQCSATHAMHCVVHGQQLVAECISDDLNFSLQYVIKAVNTIKSKQQALITRMVREHCKDKDKDFDCHAHRSGKEIVLSVS